MNKYSKLNKEIDKVRKLWSNIGFSRLSRINNKANNIRFIILTYDNRSYDFVRDVNEILKNKHPYGELIFSGHEDNFNELNSTNVKSYNVTVFKDTNLEENEYIEKLILFYKNLLDVLTKYK